MSAPASNWAGRAAAGVDAVMAPVCRLLTVIGAGCLAAMGLLTVMDVAGRYLLNRPIAGALELSEFALVVLVFLGLGATGLRGSQVVVDIVLDRFSPRLRVISDVFNALLAIGFWSVIAWRTAVQAQEVAFKGEVSTILGVPVYPFVYTVAFGSVVMGVAMVGRLLAALSRTVPR